MAEEQPMLTKEQALAIMRDPRVDLKTTSHISTYLKSGASESLADDRWIKITLPLSKIKGKRNNDELKDFLLEKGIDDQVFHQMFHKSTGAHYEFMDGSDGSKRTVSFRARALETIAGMTFELANGIGRHTQAVIGGSNGIGNAGSIRLI